ncbi:MAG TPA: L,D-transpeptidase [Nitrospirota bacterium]|nr:L,D-transpeptidase [Nitrospirota bacterium]
MRNSECGIRNERYKVLKLAIAISIVSFLLSASSVCWAGTGLDAASTEELRAAVRTLEQEAALLEEANQGLKNMLKDADDDELYLVVDTESNRLTMRQGGAVLLTAIVGTGSRQFVKEETGRNWYFESPLGSQAVLGKERNPVWIRPDWSYAEENMPVPPENDPERIVRGVLGKYALLLGNGYKIHGTKWTSLLGTHFTHGCISVGDKNLEILYKSVAVGTKVYIY